MVEVRKPLADGVNGLELAELDGFHKHEVIEDQFLLSLLSWCYFVKEIRQRLDKIESFRLITAWVHQFGIL